MSPGVPRLRALRTFEDLDLSWVRAMLARTSPEATVRTMTVERAVQGTSTHIWFSVEYESHQDSLPAQFFMKTYLDGNSNRDVILPMGLYQAEIGFYVEIAELLSLTTARCFWAAADEQGFTLVLEDLVKSREAVWGDPTTPWTREQAEAGVRQLAGLHGALWGDAPGVRFPWLQGPMAPGLVKYWQTANSPVNLERAMSSPRGEILPATLRDPSVLSSSFWKVLAYNERNANCVIHCDLHPRNIAALPDGSLVLTDWQMIRRGHCALDLNRFLGAGLDVDDRRRWESELISLYAETLQSIRSDAPSPEAIWFAYRAETIYSLLSWLREPSSMQPEAVLRSYLERAVCMATDHEALAIVEDLAHGRMT